MAPTITRARWAPGAACSPETRRGRCGITRPHNLCTLRAAPRRFTALSVHRAAAPPDLRTSAAMTTCLRPLLLLAAALLPACGATCGGYIKAGASSAGNLSSPNFPAAYPVGVHCVWVIDVPADCAVQFSFTVLDLEAAGAGGCSDYVEVRQGSRGAAVVFRGCQQAGITVVRTGGPYAWLKFHSNHGRVAAGFSAAWAAVRIGASNVTVSRGCKITEFQCPNFECVDHGYICDNVNDCGCSSWTCDEGDFYCKKAVISSWEMHTIGVCLGVGAFLVIFFTCSFLESRYNRCSGPCAAQAKGPVQPPEQEESSCCLCLPCNAKEKQALEARRQEEEQQQQLEEAYSQIVRIMIDGQRAIDWYSESGSSKAASAVPSSQASVCEVQPAKEVAYANALSPHDVPLQARGKADTRGSKAASTATVAV